MKRNVPFLVVVMSLALALGGCIVINVEKSENKKKEDAQKESVQTGEDESAEVQAEADPN